MLERLPQTKKIAFAYWLLPKKEECAYFAREVDKLAELFQAEPFEPHVTICVVARDRLAPPPRIGEIVLRPLTIGAGRKFTKTLFVQFAPSPIVSDLAKSIAGKNERIDPHLSLLYQTLTPQTRRKLARETKLPFSYVRFKRIVVMRCPLPVESPADVKKWRRVEF